MKCFIYLDFASERSVSLRNMPSHEALVPDRRYTVKYLSSAVK